MKLEAPKTLNLGKGGATLDVYLHLDGTLEIEAEDSDAENYNYIWFDEEALVALRELLR